MHAWRITDIFLKYMLSHKYLLNISGYILKIIVYVKKRFHFLCKIIIQAWGIKSKKLGYLVAIQACEAISQKSTHHI